MLFRWVMRSCFFMVLIVLTTACTQKSDRQLFNPGLSFEPYQDAFVSVYLPKDWTVASSAQQAILHSADKNITVYLYRSKEINPHISENLRSAMRHKKLDRSLTEAVHWVYPENNGLNSFLVARTKGKNELVTQAHWKSTPSPYMRNQGKYLLGILAGSFRLNTETPTVEVTQKPKKLHTLNDIAHDKNSWESATNVASFVANRDLSVSELSAWIEGDYLSFKGEKAVDINSYRKNYGAYIKMIENHQRNAIDNDYADILRLYNQESWLNDYLNHLYSDGNPLMLSLALNELPVYTTLPKTPKAIEIAYNEAASIDNTIGIESLNIARLKASKISHITQKILSDEDKNTLADFFTVTPDTTISTVMESWSIDDKLVAKLKESNSPSSDAPIYYLHTTDVLKGYRYLHNLLDTLGLPAYIPTIPSPVGYTMLSHIEEITVAIDSDEALSAHINIRFDDEGYAKAFNAMVDIYRHKMLMADNGSHFQKHLIHKAQLSVDDAESHIDLRITKNEMPAYMQNFVSELSIPNQKKSHMANRVNITSLEFSMIKSAFKQFYDGSPIADKDMDIINYKTLILGPR